MSMAGWVNICFGDEVEICFESSWVYRFGEMFIR